MAPVAAQGGLERFDLIEGLFARGPQAIWRLSPQHPFEAGGHRGSSEADPKEWGGCGIGHVDAGSVPVPVAVWVDSAFRKVPRKAERRWGWVLE